MFSNAVNQCLWRLSNRKVEPSSSQYMRDQGGKDGQGSGGLAEEANATHREFNSQAKKRDARGGFQSAVRSCSSQANWKKEGFRREERLMRRGRRVEEERIKGKLGGLV